MKQFLAIVIMSLLSLSASAREVVIPEGTKIVDYDSGYGRDTTITSVVIPNSVTEIGYRAFPGCTGLTSVEIPNSVTEIGYEAFDGCTGLTSVKIPNSVTEIGYEAFYGCTGLTSVEIPNSVTSLSGFTNCTGLTSIEIPNSVTEIGSSAFWGCKNLKSVVIPNSVTVIESGAFTYTSITQLTIPGSVVSVEDSAFMYSCALEEVVFQDGVKSIGQMAFMGCSSLKSIVFPESLETIEWSAFEFCTGLTSIEIPGSVTTVYPGAFDCQNLSKVVCWSEIPPVAAYKWYENAFSDNTLNDGILYVLGVSLSAYKQDEYWGQFKTILPIEGSELPTVTIDEIIPVCENNLPVVWRGHEIYGDTVLSYNDTLWYMSLSMHAPVVIEKYDTVFCGASYKDYGFAIKNPVSGVYTDTLSTAAGCDSIVVLHLEVNGELVIPEGTKEISREDGYSWNGCITSVKIPNSVTEIGYAAFWGCENLKSVVIPNSVTVIESGAFTYTSITQLTIPGSVVSVEDSAFKLCRALEEVVFQDGVKSIGQVAFGGCSSLKSIVFPESLETIEWRAFGGCDSLTSIEIPGSVTTVYPGAFDCQNLSKVVCWSEIPPVAAYKWYENAFSDNTLNDGILYVPGVSLSAYKQDEYWGQFKTILPIEGSELPTVTIDEIIPVCENDLPIMWREHEIYQSDTTFLVSSALSDTLYYIHLDIHASSITKLTAEVKKGEGYELGDSVYYQPGVYDQIYVSAMGCDSIIRLSLSYVEEEDTIPDVPAVTVEETISACEHDLPIDWNGYWIDQDTILTIPSKSGADTLFRISLDIHYSVRVIDSMTLKIGESYQWNNWVITEEGAYTDSFATAMGCDSIVSLYVYYKEPTDTIPTEEVDTLYYQGTMAEWCANPVVSASLKAVVIEGQIYDKNTKSLVLPEGVATIHGKAFALCPNIRTLVLPSTLVAISDSAFTSCISLASVTCYAPEPPVAMASTFGNYNGYLYIPCDYQSDYDIHVCWGTFKHVDCIAAESTVVEDVEVDPSYDSADISWPKVEDVKGYSIEIYLNGKVLLSLRFNANGQLERIDFSLGNGSVNPAPASMGSLTTLKSAIEGFRFSVSGLEEATTYRYTLKVLGDMDKVIETHSGKFTTLEKTSDGVEDIDSSKDDFIVFAQNGLISVVSEEAAPVSIYNLQGQCLFSHQGSCTFRAPCAGVYVVRCGERTVKLILNYEL